MNQEDLIHDIWHSDSSRETRAGGEAMLVAVIERTHAFDRSVAVRNAVEYLACGFVVVWFSWLAMRAPIALVRIGWAIVAASAAWIAFYLYRYGSGPDRPEPAVSLTEYRGLLVESYNRQIRLMRNVKFWYLLPPYVGILIATIGEWMRLASEGKSSAGVLIGLGAVTAFFAIVWVANEIYGVRCIERFKRELSCIEEGSES